MDYLLKQKEYIDSVEGNAHQSAVRIIGELEAGINKCLDAWRYDIASAEKEWLENALKGGD